MVIIISFERPTKLFGVQFICSNTQMPDTSIFILSIYVYTRAFKRIFSNLFGFSSVELAVRCNTTGNIVVVLDILHRNIIPYFIFSDAEKQSSPTRYYRLTNYKGRNPNFFQIYNYSVRWVHIAIQSCSYNVCSYARLSALLLMDGPFFPLLNAY